MTRTGTEIITQALREIGVLDPIEAASSEHLEDGRLAAGELLDAWRIERLTISGILIGTYSLVSGDASYTIGSGGDFNQTYPESIFAWSVVPDDDAADPDEIPMGRPLDVDQWQGIRVKTDTGPYPTVMYFDRAYSAGLGNCYFHPVPDNNDVDVKIYSRVAGITDLVVATSYDLRPGFHRALRLNLAMELAGRHGKTGDRIDKLERAAAHALGMLKRSNIRHRESPTRAEFEIGQGTGRRSFNIYTGG
jgi:hypothetical protein